MEEKTHTITCRLDEADFRKLKTEADELGVNTSDYIRLLTRLPLDCKNSTSPNRIILMDARSISILDYQVRKLGILLNQSVHALNTIAQKVSRGNRIDEEMLHMMRIVNAGLDELGAGVALLKEDTEELKGKEIAFHDWYRRKPIPKRNE